MYIEQVYKGLTDSWRYVVSIILIFVGWQVFGGLPLIAAVVLKSDSLAVLASGDLGLMAQTLGSNLFLFFMLLSFVIGLVFLLIAIKFVHKQPFLALTTSRKKIDWKRIFFAFALWGMVSIALTAIGIYLAPEDYVFNFEPIPFFILVVIGILFIPLQTSFEEYLFRGYLMQGIGLWAKNKWMPLVITSLVFGLLHIANPEVGKLGYGIMVFYIGTGLFLGVITLMDDGLELALGFHAANNLFTALLVTADWTAFQTHSLYRDVSEPKLGWDVFIPVLIIYPILLYLFSKKYKWNQWRERLTAKILAKNEFNAHGELHLTEVQHKNTM
ncbi:CPBP family intramembrane glutamic endopeptidase [Arenibacter sp. GZD96]|uniref:CPBP family intramembrane glutamic endopeptidase n=1 Tax=Aurantibrevibacter litoralis TaxID=3106030 RepID=UPI002AFE56AB|nr:CPBP family intramembrane glutamic endopeptidase [Arenibacter sp. GZD-96]MEA1786273.1 CPBP family intramembrane glutamic endopeptidase [Arenibacter sp. GZD-96]